MALLSACARLELSLSLSSPRFPPPPSLSRAHSLYATCPASSSPWCIFFAFISPKLQKPFFCSMFPEPTQPSWLTSSMAHFYFCLYLKRKKKVLLKNKMTWKISQNYLFHHIWLWEFHILQQSWCQNLSTKELGCLLKGILGFFLGLCVSLHKSRLKNDLVSFQVSWHANLSPIGLNTPI